MAWSGALHPWFRLPSRIALLLGLGALSAAGARADMGGMPTATVDPAETMIRIEAGQIFISERGGDFRRLDLSDEARAALLRQLRTDPGEGMRVPATILAGAGGSGFHNWAPADTRRDRGSGAAENPQADRKALAPADAQHQRKAAPQKSTIQGSRQSS